VHSHGFHGLPSIRIHESKVIDEELVALTRRKSELNGDQTIRLEHGWFRFGSALENEVRKVNDEALPTRADLHGLIVVVIASGAQLPTRIRVDVWEDDQDRLRGSGFSPERHARVG